MAAMKSPRPVSFPTDGGFTLEGVLHLPDATPAPGIVVCHPHPLYGGDMNNNVVALVCRVAVERGIAALRFNFRGTGRSEGRHEGGQGERLDIAMAVEYMRGLAEVDGQRVAVAGYSFGAAVALAAGLEGLRAMALVSLPTMMLPAQPAALPYPVLLIAGDEDEYVDQDDLSELAQALRAELVFVSGADHFWWGHEGPLAEALGGFLGRHLG